MNFYNTRNDTQRLLRSISCFFPAIGAYNCMPPNICRRFSLSSFLCLSRSTSSCAVYACLASLIFIVLIFNPSMQSASQRSLPSISAYTVNLQTTCIICSFTVSLYLYPLPAQAIHPRPVCSHCFDIFHFRKQRSRSGCTQLQKLRNIACSCCFVFL